MDRPHAISKDRFEELRVLIIKQQEVNDEAVSSVAEISEEVLDASSVVVKKSHEQQNRNLGAVE